MTERRDQFGHPYEGPASFEEMTQSDRMRRRGERLVWLAVGIAVLFGAISLVVIR